MAWNQPGGSKNPWGRRPGQGGSSLDEKMKRWQRRLEALLRPGAAGGGGADRGDKEVDGSGASLPILIGLILLAIWLLNGFYQIGPAERGVIQRFGKLVGEPRGEGWGWRFPWPIEKVLDALVKLSSNLEGTSWADLKKTGYARFTRVGKTGTNIGNATDVRPDDTITVVLPEFVARHWWEQILHNQSALRIKAALLFRPGTVVTSVPYHLERPS